MVRKETSGRIARPVLRIHLHGLSPDELLQPAPSSSYLSWMPRLWFYTWLLFGTTEYAWVPFSEGTLVAKSCFAFRSFVSISYYGGVDIDTWGPRDHTGTENKSMDVEVKHYRRLFEKESASKELGASEPLSRPLREERYRHPYRFRVNGVQLRFEMPPYATLPSLFVMTQI